MKRILIFIVLFTGIAHSVSANCWDSVELSQIEGFADLEEEILLSFKDATQCEPIVSATVSIDGDLFKTDDKGYVTLSPEKFNEMMDESIPLKITKTGFITLTTKLIVTAGNIWNRRFLLSKELPLDKVRLVLQWGGKPRDLDLHLKNDEFHISFRNMMNYKNKASLDRDDRDGYGPETITVDRMEKGKKYSVFIENYSNEAPINDEAVVYFYANNALQKTVTLPRTKEKRVDLFQIDSGRLVQ